MDGHFVTTWRNLHIEINAKELVSSLLKEYTSMTETELINRAKRLISSDGGHWPQECSVAVLEEEPFLLEEEVIVYQEKYISYHALLAAIVTVLGLLHEDL